MNASAPKTLKLTVSGPLVAPSNIALVWHMPCHSYLSREKKNMVYVMKIEIPILAALLLLGSELMARAAVQGVEQALVSTVIEWSMSRVKSAGKILR